MPRTRKDIEQPSSEELLDRNAARPDEFARNVLRQALLPADVRVLRRLQVWPSTRGDGCVFSFVPGARVDASASSAAVGTTPVSLPLIENATPTKAIAVTRMALITIALGFKQAFSHCLRLLLTPSAQNVSRAFAIGAPF